MEQVEQFDVFLSHNSADKPQVEWLASKLEERGLRPFLDKWDLSAGRSWRNDLEIALANSKTAVVFFGPHGVGPWHDAEIDILLERATTRRNDFRVTSILLPGATLDNVPLFLRRLGRLDFSQQWEDQSHVEELVSFVTGSPYREGLGDLPDEPAPYRGLERFESEHANLFFGRDHEVRDLAQRLSRGRLVAVIGGSGCGKSSLVRAGLQRAAAKEEQSDILSWRIITVEPGNDPFRAVADAIRRKADQCALILEPADRIEWADKQAARLVSRTDGLRTTIASVFGGSTETTVLLIDQFEELFTHDQGSRDRSNGRSPQTEAFIAAVVDCVESGPVELKVLITLRAEFVHCCLQYPELYRLLQDKILLLGDPSDDGLRELIKLPASHVGAYLETGLVELIVQEFRSQTGSLPLLEHMLLHLWRMRQGRWLTLASYNDSDGLRGALDRHADRSLSRLPSDAHREMARQIFVYRLITPGDGVPDTRLRVLRSSLYPEDVSKHSIVDDVLRELSGKDSRLIVINGESPNILPREPDATEQTHVEITHEALLRGWKQLGLWLTTARSVLRQCRYLSEHTREWIKTGRPVHDDAYLLKGRLLEDAEALVATGDVSLNADEHAFIKASRDFRQSEVLVRRTHRLRQKQLIIGVISTTAIAFVAFMAYLHIKSVASAVVAEQKRLNRRVVFNVQVEKAAAKYLTNPVGAMKLLEDSELCPSQLRDGAWNHIYNSCQRSLYQSQPHSQRVNDLCLTTDGQFLFTASDDHEIGLCKLKPGAPAEKFVNAHHDKVWSLAISPDDKRLISVGKDGNACVWNTRTGSLVQKIPVQGGETHEMNVVKYSPDGKTIAIGVQKHGVLLVDSTDPMKQRWLNEQKESINALAFSATGTHLVAGDLTGKLHLWDTESLKHLDSLQAHSDYVICVDHSPYMDQDLFATSGMGDKSIKTWSIDAEKIQAKDELQIPNSPEVGAVLFFSNSSHLLSTHRTSLYVWDLIDKSRCVVASVSQTSDVEAVSLARTDKPYEFFVGNRDGSVTRLDLDPLGRGVLHSAFDRKSDVLTSAVWPGSLALTSVLVDGSLWDYDSSLNASRLRCQIPGACAVAALASPDVAVGTESGAVYVSGKNTAVNVIHELHQQRISSIVYDPRLSRLTTSDVSGQIVVFEMSTKKASLSFRTSEQGNSSLAISSRNQRMFAGDRAGEVSVWDRDHQLRQASFGSKPILGISLRPDDQEIAVMDSEGHVWIADAGDLKQKVSFQAGSGMIRSIVHLPSGSLATAGLAIQFWDSETGLERLSIDRVPSLVNFLEWSDSHQRLIATCQTEILIFNMARTGQ